MLKHVPKRSKMARSYGLPSGTTGLSLPYRRVKYEKRYPEVLQSYVYLTISKRHSEICSRAAGSEGGWLTVFDHSSRYHHDISPLQTSHHNRDARMV
jgi:hypothetical protein